MAVHAKFISLPRPLPLGEVDLRSKDGEGEDAALAQQSTLLKTAKSSPLRESWQNRQVLTERGVQEKFSAVVTSVISVQ